MIEHRLKEWTKQQILAEKHILMDKMNTATQHVDPAVFQSTRGNADICFIKADVINKEIGFITTPPSAKQSSTATLTFQSYDDSMATSTLSSPKDVISDKSAVINQAHNKGNSDQLALEMGTARPITVTPLSSLPYDMRGKTFDIITGIKHPYCISSCDNGDIVVAEHGECCITFLNSKKIKQKLDTKRHNYIASVGVAMSVDGHVLVTCPDQLLKLTTDGVCVKSVGSSEEGIGRLQFHFPRGITVHPTTGQIFVADSGNNRIQVFSNDLTFSQTITLNHGSCPYDVALDDKGYLYVAENLKDCITKLTATGQYVARFGSYGSAPGQLRGPSSLTINNNLVYVSEYFNNRVSIFDTAGKFLHCFGKKGSEKGEFDSPRGIAMDTSGNLYISDYRNNRIIVC